jgi:hypothetical protein
MMLAKTDLPHIKWSLLVFLSILCLGVAAIAASRNYLSMALRAQIEAQRQLIEPRSRLLTAEEDQKNMQTYTLEYGALLERNIIGEGLRLDWIEGLEKIRKQHRVPDFKYTIAPQHPFTPFATQDSGNFDLMLSDMALQFDLLHEEQLIVFFDALRSDSKGRFLLDHCTLERSASPTGEEILSGATPPLKAKCGGGWLTLKNRNTT